MSHMHTNKHTHRDQLQVEHYEFDHGLQLSHVSPNVDAGKVVIDNLTHNSMKTRQVTMM